MPYLGVDIKTTSVPQAKGRIERLNQTFQSRLPVELRRAHVSNIDEANEFLKSYLKKFNAQFALQLDITKSVFETQPSKEKINTILAIMNTRIIDNGHGIRYKNKYLMEIFILITWMYYTILKKYQIRKNTPNNLIQIIKK